MSVAAVHDFPVDMLEGHHSALIVFSAAFGGMQDAAHIRDAGLRGTCVDNNPEKLREMVDDYPEDWRFICWDAFALAPFLAPEKFDVVTLDPFTGHDMDNVHQNLDVFCDMAREVVIVGSVDKTVTAPAGWRVSHRVKRARGVYWTVLLPG